MVLSYDAMFLAVPLIFLSFMGFSGLFLVNLIFILAFSIVAFLSKYSLFYNI